MKTSRNRYRIIGGTWRSRQLAFPDGKGLRPTADRVRETLFNWLQPILPGAHCLDLFAGSGALSFEALSRGATQVTCLERNPAAADAIHANARLLQTSSLTLLRTDAMQWLRQQQAQRFDIVFLDPPFDLNLLESCCDLLSSQQLVAPGGMVYLESGRALTTLTLPAGWSLIREKKAGQVHYGMAVTPRDGAQ
jgi:16S rRNA (guanine966-N2)-methyltransferase